MNQSQASKANPASMHELLSMKHSRPLLACRFDPAGKFLFTGAQDYLIQRWDLASGKPVPLEGHGSWVRAFAFSKAGDVLISGGMDGHLLFWRFSEEQPKPMKDLAAHEGWIRSLAVSPDGQWLASAGNDAIVRVWSVAEGTKVSELKGHQRHVYSVGFHPEGKHLVSADLMGVVKVWELESGKPVRDLDAAVLHKYDGGFHADIGGIKGMSFSPDGGLLACAGITEVSNAFAGLGKPIVVTFDWTEGKQKEILKPRDDFTGTAWRPLHHPAGFWFAVGGGHGGGVIWFWKPGDSSSFHAHKLSSDGFDVDLHPDGTRLAVAQVDGTARIFSLLPKEG
ncbi:MAG: WD40 repeat domain-containing protein [Planctomycetota bacterium]